ncbi:MAG: glycosyltransferase family 4 protein [Leptolyngbyaceae cyanobacterium SU_3_3]|nr:glycosyltransferase family 4 protein [Leptolyngbyaceae cyanobacterium SU_3_3]
MQTFGLGTTKNYVAPFVAKDQNFKVIAIPQNLESFVPDAFHESLSTEIQALAKADIVFCISREEEWLLRLHGANAHYLPYYPPHAIEQHLLTIRRDRAPKNRYLILGSASNPPTRQGMIEQIHWLKQIRQHLSFEVDIVGYKTESLQEYCDETFVLHGTVSDNQLTTILTQTKTALIHQTASSGALTRIPELLTAGIPVVANGNACRSAHSYSGIYCYDDLFELLDRLNQPLDPAPMLPRPVTAEKRFIDAVQHLSQSSPNATIASL